MTIWTSFPSFVPYYQTQVLPHVKPDPMVVLTGTPTTHIISSTPDKTVYTQIRDEK